MPESSSSKTILQKINFIKNEPFSASNIAELEGIIASGTMLEVLEAKITKAKLLIDFGKYDESFIILDDIEKNYKINDETIHSIVKVYGYKGNIFIKIANRPKAIEQFLKALHIFKKVNNVKGEAMTYISLSNCISRIDNTNKAEEYCKKAIDILKTLEGCEIPTLVGYIAMCNFYSASGNMKAYYEIIDKVILLVDKITNLRWKGVAMLHTADALLLKGKFDEAIIVTEKTVDILSKAKYYPGLVSAYTTLANVYFSLKNHETALKYTKIGLEKCDEAGDVDREVKLLELLSSIYEKMQKPIDALDAWKKMTALKLEVHEKNKIHLVSEVEAQYKIKELETANKIAYQKLLRSEELNQELEQFAYMTSHDLKAPLRVISSLSNLLKSEGVSNEEASEYLQHIEINSKRMSKLIDSLLEYSRMGFTNIPLSTTSLEDVLKVAVQSLEKDIKDTSAIISYNSLAQVHGNHIVLVQLFQNLLSNAIKYNERSPIINISSKNLENGNTLISIKDNGIGIGKEHIDKIFSAFSRVHPQSKYDGNGIGLAICKKIINAHEGKLSVESEKDIGSTFYLELKNVKS